MFLPFPPSRSRISPLGRPLMLSLLRVPVLLKQPAKSGFSTDKGGIDCCEGAHSSDKECQIQTGVSEKVSIKTAAKNTRQAAAKPKNQNRRHAA